MKDRAPLFCVRKWSKDKKNFKLGYIDAQGQWVIEPEYDRAEGFQEGVAIVVKDGKKFLINARNEKIFDVSDNVNLFSFSKGLAVAYSEVKPRRFQYGYMNLSGELIIPLEYERAEPFREGRGVVQSSETKKWGAVDSSGKLAIPHKFLNGIYFRDGMAVTAEDSSGMGVIDRNGAYMVSPKFESIGRFSEGLARAVDKKTRKYGFINSKGEYEIEPTISYANEFSNGFAAMHDKQSKWGYIDKSGNITIPTKFNSTGDFSEEIADVLTHKWGYINKLGDWIIQPAFTRAYPFLNGIADVEIKKKHGLINPKGEFILEPIYNHIDNTLPTLLRVTLSTNPKSPSFEQYFTRNGKLVWSEFESVPMTSPSPKRKKMTSLFRRIFSPT